MYCRRRVLQPVRSAATTLFDAYIFVDWSAASRRHPIRPKADAVWVGELVPSIGHRHQTYHRTRASCIDQLTESLLDHVVRGRRVLIGFDFPYGYPTGFAQALGLPADSQPWFSIWKLLVTRVKDNANNKNNRFKVAAELNGIFGGDKLGPVWGCPKNQKTSSLSTHSPVFPFRAGNEVQLKRLRMVEERLRGTQETWKLFYIGSVGSQALVGIPCLYKLRRHPQLARVSKVWPFETGFTPEPVPRGHFILHAEIWPGVVDQRAREIEAQDSLIRDQAQVRAMCEWAAECDSEGSLGQYFDDPKGLDDEQVRRCIEEEGWVLGAI